MKYKNRCDVEEKYKWDLKEFYKTDEEWNKKYKNTVENINIFKKYKNTLNNVDKLLEYLEHYMTIRCELLNIYVYAYLNHDVDLSNSKYIQMLEMATELYTKFNIEIAYFKPELLKIDENEFNVLLNDDRLSKYKVYLEDIYKEKKHTLSEEEEKIIYALSSTFDSYQNISSSLLNSENNYGVITTSDGITTNILLSNFRKIKQDANEDIRRRAHNKFYKVIKQYQDTEASLLNNFIKNNTTLSKIHKYNSTWDEYIENEKLTNEIFASLQSACEKSINVNQKFYKLMKKTLKLNVLHSYDTVMKWNSSKNYTIEEAQEIVVKSLSILGDKYNEKLKKIFDNHYIDYCPYKGKTSGGYSYSTYNITSRILMNFNGEFDDISTIAHESGHNVHHQFINDNNHSWYSNQSTIVCEVASLTNEFLLANWMINNSNTKEEKLIGLEHILKVYQNNFFGAIMEGQLEVMMYNKINNGEMITAQFLNDEMNNLLEKYQGKTINRGSYTKYMWAIRSHYYMVYYLFSYAISVSVAATLADKIINKENKILDKYYKFLSAGSDIKPVDVFKILDIDIESEEVYLNGIKYFDKQLDNYAKIYEGGK